MDDLDNYRNLTKRKSHGLKLPQTLTEIDPEGYFDEFKYKPQRVWISRKFVVQLFNDDNTDFPNLQRLSINRTKWSRGRWVDGITWDELQAIKSEIGFGDVQAIELYPPDSDVVNVANIRHLWLLPNPLSITLKSK